MQGVVRFREARDWKEVFAARRELDEVMRDRAVWIPLWTDPQFVLFNKSLRVPDLPDVREYRCAGPWLFHRLVDWRRET